MPRHLHYCEPFFGGGAVLLTRDPEDDRLWLPPHKGVSEVVNDCNKSLTNFWQVLRDPDAFRSFLRMVEATPFAEAEWQASAGRLVPLPPFDVAAAHAFFVRCRMSLAGRMDVFTGITRTRTRRGMSNDVSAWLSAVEGLPEVHERLKRVLILNRDALDVIRSQDGPQVLHYCDPPYVRETRTAPDVYAHEMTDDQHRELLDVLLACKGKVMLSGYRSAMYDELHERHGWRLVEWTVPNHSAGNPAVKGALKARRVEACWLNYAPDGSRL